MLQQWEVVYPTLTRGPLYAWTARAPKPAGPPQSRRDGRNGKSNRPGGGQPSRLQSQGASGPYASQRRKEGAMG